MSEYETNIDRKAVAEHLANNDVSLAFARVACKAIDCCNIKQSDRRLKLPTNVTMPAYEIVDRLHLGAFLSIEDDEDTAA